LHFLILYTAYIILPVMHLMIFYFHVIVVHGHKLQKSPSSLQRAGRCRSARMISSRRAFVRSSDPLGMILSSSVLLVLLFERKTFSQHIPGLQIFVSGELEEHRLHAMV